MEFFLLKFPIFCVSQNFVKVFQKALWSVCLFVCYKYHEDEWFQTSGFSLVHFRLLEPTTQDTLRKLKKWRTRRSENLSEIMSSKGKDYKRISGLAKPLAECKTEVRFYSTHCVHYAWVTRVVNTRKNVLTKSGSRLFKTLLRNAGTCRCYGLLLGTVPVYTHISFSEHCSY